MSLSNIELQHYQIDRLANGPIRAVETRSAYAITLYLNNPNAVSEELLAEAFELHRGEQDNGQDVKRPIRLGQDRQVVGYDSYKNALVSHRIHLLFAQPLESGVVYQLSIPATLGGTDTQIPVKFDPSRINSSIQVNQVGYLPAAIKLAYIGNWLGTAGPLPIHQQRFEVIARSSGNRILEGPIELRQRADPWSGNDVYTADFSALQAPGQYQIRVPGLGVSEGFEIAAEVYQPAAGTVLRLFYHSRNGTAILSPWADPGYERPEGGVPAELDGLYHSAVPRSVLGCSTLNCRDQPISHGWFDAGDYGQYVPNAAPIWHYASVAFDLSPERFRDDALNIPESGNGIPDLLDELEWGMDWMLSMQDKDGGVFFRIASLTWDDQLPHLITEPRLIAEKTTHATASFAAAAAIHARLIAAYRPARSAEVLDAAERAWNFLLTRPQWPIEGEQYENPEGVNAGRYSDKSALDNRLWAAAELFRATGATDYAEAYRAEVEDVFVDPTAAVSYREQTLAAFWAWLKANPDERSPSQSSAQARQALIDAANWRLRVAEDNPYHAPVHRYIGFVGWGSFAHSTRATIPLLQAYHLTNERQYRDWALRSTDALLGANPQSLSYITGIGARSPRYPLSKLSEYDDNPEPLNGIPVPGPHWRMGRRWPEWRIVDEVYQPPAKPQAKTVDGNDDFSTAYPVLRRYTDAQLLPPMSEPTVVDYAQVGIALRLLGSHINISEQ